MEATGHQAGLERGAIRLGRPATEVLHEKGVGQDSYYRVFSGASRAARKPRSKKVFKNSCIFLYIQAR
jgi:hypothetical protein